MSKKKLVDLVSVLGSIAVLLSLSAVGLGGVTVQHGSDENGSNTTTASDKPAHSDKGSSETKAGESKPGALSAEEQLRVLSEKVRKLESLIELQQQAIEMLQSKARPDASPTALNAAVPLASSPPIATGSPTPPTVASVPQAAKPAQGSAQVIETPLQFHIGSATITPVGFMDFTAVFRSTNLGSGIGTNFGGIPFNNVPAGKLTELRLSAQNSRIGARVDADMMGAHVIGYLESDFLGFVPGNAAVSTNSVNQRLRLYWADVRWNKWEVMGGQSWTLMTPGRKGISPIPDDIFYSKTVDVNYQLGLTWARQPGFRLVYHHNDEVAFGLALENAEQYIGGSAGGGLVTLPSALATAYANQLSNGNTTLNVPNLHPDVIAKLAFDPTVGGRLFHIELAGVASSIKVFNPLSQRSFTATGGGGAANVNIELVKNFRFIANNFFSDGAGRYIFGQAPDAIIRGDGSPSLVHSFSNVTGFELKAGKTEYYAYYGGAYINKNTAIDPANGRLVGYGFPGSPSGQNRSIQEGTLGFTQTFWRDPKYGALQLMGQYSYLTRSPWAVAAGSPGNAHSNMVFINLRYLLPGSAPKTGK